MKIKNHQYVVERMIDMLERIQLSPAHSDQVKRFSKILIEQAEAWDCQKIYEQTNEKRKI